MATETFGDFFDNQFEKLKNTATNTIDGLKRQYNLDTNNNPWPQTIYKSDVNRLYNSKTKGFLPPILITPLSNSYTNNTNDIGGTGSMINEVKKYNEYEYKDWMGQSIVRSLNGENNYQLITTDNKFNFSGNIPKSDDRIPYSTRDMYLIFDDLSTDYFKHGLSQLTPLNKDQGDLRLNSFYETPYEKNDPVMFGFEIIMDDIHSPLLNGSILDFLNNYSNVSEIRSKIPVYEDFKNQFIKFFKTKSTVRIDENDVVMSKNSNVYTTDERGYKDAFVPGGKSYMSYYLKKIDGLDKLVESNTPDAKKYLVDYNKDIISLNFNEDLTLSIGTLAYLYKLLYWSKPNGKSIVPENLLRFNCDIIISEVRNFNKVRKAITEGVEGLQIIKDNVSRYVYSLKECQFYFNNMAHSNDVDLSNINVYDNYTIQFDYKYSTVKLERFIPNNNGFGEYLGYDSGAIWKVGNSQDRSTSDLGTININMKSVPNFEINNQTSNINRNGVLNEMVLSTIKPSDIITGSDDNNTEAPLSDSATASDSSILFERFKEYSVSKSQELMSNLQDTIVHSATRELQSFINKKTAILNKELNKITSSIGIDGINPPKNIYTDSKPTTSQRIWFDVRGQLLNFTGDALGDALGGGGFTGGQNLQR